MPAGVVWHQPGPDGQEPDVGPNGKMAVTEVTFDRPGAASPFGEDKEFPLPPDAVNYQHPSGGDE